MQYAALVSPELLDSMYAYFRKSEETFHRFPQNLRRAVIALPFSKVMSCTALATRRPPRPEPSA